VPVKQSVCWPLFRPEGMPLDEYFGIIASIGYPAIELWARDEQFVEIVETAHKHGLVVASMSGHASLPDGLNKPENHDRIEAELRASIALAA